MQDPKEVALTDRNSGCPRTRQQIIDWFTRDNDPFNIKNIISLMDHGNFDTYPNLWNKLLDYNLCGHLALNGWVTRSGRPWPCEFAGHEILVKLMGLETSTVEDAGWIRISGASLKYLTVRSTKRPSLQQARFLRNKGFTNSLMTLPRLAENDPVILQYE